jgi:hypothetical protein
VIGDLYVTTSGALRFGKIADADASKTTVRIGGGAAWRMFTFGPSHALSLGLDVELAGVEQMVRRSDTHRSRWITAAYMTARLGWRVTPVFEPFFAAGVETVFGATPIVVGGLTVAEIAPVSAAAEAGVALHWF